MVYLILQLQLKAGLLQLKYKNNAKKQVSKTIEKYAQLQC